MNKHLESAKEKMIEQLDLWCGMYKIIGSKGETPRYSQILRSGFGLDGDYQLKSTISGVCYKLELTKEEERALDEHEDTWAWWKSIRTEYLKENHPTISPY